MLQVRGLHDHHIQKEGWMDSRVCKSPQVGHVPEGQAADHRVRILTVLPQCVDDQQRQLWIQRGIGAQEDIDQLLLDNVYCGTCFDHLTEQAGDIQTLRHQPGDTGGEGWGCCEDERLSTVIGQIVFRVRNI